MSRYNGQQYRRSSSEGMSMARLDVTSNDALLERSRRRQQQNLGSSRSGGGLKPTESFTRPFTPEQQQKSVPEKFPSNRPHPSTNSSLRYFWWFAVYFSTFPPAKNSILSADRVYFIRSRRFTPTGSEILLIPTGQHFRHVVRAVWRCLDVFPLNPVRYPHRVFLFRWKTRANYTEFFPRSNCPFNFAVDEICLWIDQDGVRFLFQRGSSPAVTLHQTRPSVDVVWSVGRGFYVGLSLSGDHGRSGQFSPLGRPRFRPAKGPLECPARAGADRAQCRLRQVHLCEIFRHSEAAVFSFGRTLSVVGCDVSGHFRVLSNATAEMLRLGLCLFAVVCHVSNVVWPHRVAGFTGFGHFSGPAGV